jgi:hypothetical protein
MPLRYLLDENLRGGALWRAIRQHNAAGADLLDVVRVGDPSDLPCGSDDSAILLWAEREARILVSLDRQTIPAHLTNHLKAGQHCPGIILIRPHATLANVLSYLVAAAYAADPGGYQDRIEYVV